MEKRTLLIEAFDDTEATLIVGMLEAAGIPVEREDSDAFVGVMRVVGGMAYGIDIYVPEQYYQQARKLLDSSELSNEHEDEA